ncbi:uncharacterized protein TNCV_4478841 [Trichonephila clavipes]|nr:uncharacterized protein TNCV_4478841 [Trichonephila clavipes]
MLTILLIQELDREVTTVLTTSSPYIVENAVEYSYKERTYKPLQNQSNAIVFFQQRGNIKRKSPQQETKDANKEVGVEELDTKRKNKFNFCDRATQTSNFLLSGKVPSAIVPTSTMKDLTYAENVDVHYMYGRANSNGRAALCVYHLQFPDPRMLDHRSFQWLHRQLRETRSIQALKKAS